MYKENLFELIRREEVIIWAGAGMSLYAGYPSGAELIEILLKNLTSTEKERININLPLTDLAEEFYRLKGNNKNSLIRILNETFSKKPKSIDTHKRLVIIPHFKTIITTNYDTLFEDSFGQKGQKIYTATQIPYINSKKTQIFKVHGDLNEPESIILTKSDYNNFFKENKDNSTYWSVIKERLSTNTILFLGYNLEDPNVSVIFDRITESLGENRKEAFLVAPNLPQHKINTLIKKDIHYLNYTAENLISELLFHLKENIISDIENGKTSADTFRNFLANIDLLPDLKAEKDSYKVTSIKATNKDISGTANFIFKKEKKFLKKLSDFKQGKTFEPLEVPTDKLLNIDFWYGGVKFPYQKGGIKLEFKSIPRIEYKIDIKFDDDFEFLDIPTKVYHSSSLLEIHLEFDNAEVIAKVNLEITPNTKVNVRYQHKEICKNIKSEIEFFSFLKRMSEGKIFTVYPESGGSANQSFSPIPEILEQSNFFLNYFTNLKKIEDYFNIRFSNMHIDDIDKSNIETVNHIISILENEYLIYNCDDELTATLTDDYTDEVVQNFENLNKTDSSLSIQEKEKETLRLHNQDIILGYKKMEFQNVTVINIQEISERKNNIVRMLSKKVHISYTKNIEELNIP